MKNSIIDNQIYQDLITQVNEEMLEKANKIAENKNVNITKVIYDDKNNFELHAEIKRNSTNIKESRNVYIKISEGEIENLSCTCEEYKKNYCACEHIIATVKEFINNPDYIRIFMGNDNSTKFIKENEKHSENYKVFNQLVKEFYHVNEEEENEDSNTVGDGYIHIEPKLIYSKFNNTLKLEIKIGEKQLYKVKSLPEFYDRFMNREKYKYGAKLEFVHTREKIVEEDRKILDFVLKYAEIIKYANETSTGYDYYTKRLGEDTITISNTGLDDLFESLENKTVMMESQYGTENVLFVPNEPEIKFKLEETKKRRI